MDNVIFGFHFFEISISNYQHYYYYCSTIKEKAVDTDAMRTLNIVRAKRARRDVE